MEFNDATLFRVEHSTLAWGYDAFVITNAFSIMGRHFAETVQQADDPVHPENDSFIVDAVLHSALTICGWSRWALWQQRHTALLELLKPYHLHALKINKDGTPAHPLYLPRASQPFLWQSATC
jgi:hypothetical protein